MQNKVVLHFLNGEIVKGTTLNFFREEKLFHIIDRETERDRMVDPRTLKGVFFVKSFDGNPEYRERHDVDRAGLGKKVRVSFKDGECLVGYTTEVSGERLGFFLFVPDVSSNNEKVFVMKVATRTILLSRPFDDNPLSSPGVEWTLSGREVLVREDGGQTGHEFVDDDIGRRGRHRRDNGVIGGPLPVSDRRAIF